MWIVLVWLLWVGCKVDLEIVYYGVLVFGLEFVLVCEEVYMIFFIS